MDGPVTNFSRAIWKPLRVSYMFYLGGFACAGYMCDAVKGVLWTYRVIDGSHYGSGVFSSGVRCPNPASSIAFTSSGPTCGLLDIGDVCEVKGTESKTVKEEEEEKVLETQEVCILSVKYRKVITCVCVFWKVFIMLRSDLIFEKQKMNTTSSHMTDSPVWILSFSLFY